VADPLLVPDPPFQPQVVQDDRRLLGDGMHKAYIAAAIGLLGLFFAEHQHALDPLFRGERHDEPHTPRGQPPRLATRYAGPCRQRHAAHGSQTPEIFENGLADRKGRSREPGIGAVGEPHDAAIAPPEMQRLGMEETLQLPEDEAGDIFRRVQPGQFVHQPQYHLFAVVLFAEEPPVEPPEQRHAELQAQAQRQDPVQVGAVAGHDLGDAAIAMDHQGIEQGAAGQRQESLKDPTGKQVLDAAADGDTDIEDLMPDEGVGYSQRNGDAAPTDSPD
jgi:hypothetical protein